jgi:hypothetical protein
VPSGAGVLAHRFGDLEADALDTAIDLNHPAVKPFLAHRCVHNELTQLWIGREWDHQKCAPPAPGRLQQHPGFESRHLESRPKAAARLDLEVSAGWASPSSRDLWGGDALMLSTGAAETLDLTASSTSRLHLPLACRPAQRPPSVRILWGSSPRPAAAGAAAPTASTLFGLPPVPPAASLRLTLPRELGSVVASQASVRAAVASQVVDRHPAAVDAVLQLFLLRVPLHVVRRCHLQETPRERRQLVGHRDRHLHLHAGCVLLTGATPTLRFTF